MRFQCFAKCRMKPSRQFRPQHGRGEMSQVQFHLFDDEVIVRIKFRQAALELVGDHFHKLLVAIGTPRQGCTDVGKGDVHHLLLNDME